MLAARKLSDCYARVDLGWGAGDANNFVAFEYRHDAALFFLPAQMMLRLRYWHVPSYLRQCYSNHRPIVVVASGDATLRTAPLYLQAQMMLR